MRRRYIYSFLKSANFPTNGDPSMSLKTLPLSSDILILKNELVVPGCASLLKENFF